MSPSTIDSVRKCIAEGRRVAAHAAKAETRAKLEEICRDLDQILLEIAALEAAGKVEDQLGLYMLGVLRWRCGLNLGGHSCSTTAGP